MTFRESDNFTVAETQDPVLRDAEAIIEEELAVLDDASIEESEGSSRYDVASYGADYVVDALVKRLRNGDILIPDFQRNYVWTISDASRFIESLLLGLPVPGIFLAREPTHNRLLVIDGQQRLKSLEFYYEGFFNPARETKRKEVFRLVGVQIQFEGKTYTELPSEYQRLLDDSIIHATIVKQEAPADGDTSIYHIFERLNSQGRKLYPQEIRTALYHGRFVDLLKELNQYESWRAIYGKPSPRLKDQELILRFLALVYARSEYSSPMEDFLSKYLSTHRNPGEEQLATMAKTFKEAIDIAIKQIGWQGFRPIRALNAAVFDSTLVAIAALKQRAQLNEERLGSNFKMLLERMDYEQATVRSTSNEASVRDRITIAIEVLGAE